MPTQVLDCLSRNYVQPKLPNLQFDNQKLPQVRQLQHMY